MLFYIIENEEKIPPTYTVEKNNIVYRHHSDIRYQAEKIGYPIDNYSFLHGKISDAPRNIKHDAICFLTENTLVESDYLLKLISAYNLYRNSSCICGPVFNDNKHFLYENIAYHSLSITLNSTHEYPRMNNILIPSAFYNSVSGYRPVVTARGHYCVDIGFFEKLRAMGQIVYSSVINTFEHFTKNEKIDIRYYTSGYEDAKFKIEKFEEPDNLPYKIGFLEGSTGKISSL